MRPGYHAVIFEKGIMGIISDRDKKTLEKAKKTAAEIREVSRLKATGLSQAQIAESMKLPESRIRTLVERYGIN